ncbi:MAG: hypothetical protein OXC01_21915 [Immundisolibacterales bacterium]|nr:hypothetical protein [Immundisolibacterales bacterium]
MRWPWSKREAAPERREAVPFTDAVVAALGAQAAGTATGDPSAIAALEAAAGLYATAFASATVTPSNPMTAALTPACRALIARDLIRRGEHVSQIIITGGGVRLQPIGSWDVRGPADERGWWYRIDEYGPSDNRTRVVAGQSVIHCRYAVDSARPWYGLAPLQWARATGTLAANLESRLGEEAGGPVGHILPVPAPGAPGGEGDDFDDPLTALRADLAAGEGKTLLAETTSAGWGEGKAGAPNADWKPQRFGASPPDVLPTLRTDAALAVLAACQVPAGLFTDADGTSQREAWRRWAMGPLAGLAAVVEAEIAAKLDQPVRLGFDGLWAHDLAGRAASFKAMVGGGMDIAKAAGLAGLMAGE